jgi:subtilisin family serine protease
MFFPPTPTRSALAVCVSLLCGALSFGAAAKPPADKGEARVIVAFKHGKSAEAHAAIAQRKGRVVVDLSEIDALAVSMPANAVDGLRRNPNVEYVEEDAERHISALAQPSAAPYQPGQREPYGIRMVQADQLPDSFASDRTLCIVDSGYDRAHEDLGANVVTGYNLTRSGEWFTDEARHGTHVGGTISALDNPNVGVVGVLPHQQIRLHIEKVFDASGSNKNSVIDRAVLNCVKAGANVISLSLGGPDASRTDQRTFEKVVAANVLAIAAAGNDEATTPGATSYPAGYAGVMSVAAIGQDMKHASFSQSNATVAISGPGINVLSTVPMGSGREAALSVGPLDPPVLPTEGTPAGSVSAPLADFGTGQAVDAGMAGKVCLIKRGAISFADKVLNCQNSGGIGAVIFNNDAAHPGEPVSATLGGTVTTIPSATTSLDDGNALLGQIGQVAALDIKVSNYEVFQGTSMATPHVSAVAALVWSYFPHCTAAQIAGTLTKSALDLGAPGRDDETGFGLVQAKAAYDRITRRGCGN